MQHSFILKNQDGHYWGRSKEWVDGSDRSRVAQYKHRDEASNTVFELSSKDFGLRAEIMEIRLKDGKLPKLTISQIALPDREVDDKESSHQSIAQASETPHENSDEGEAEQQNDSNDAMSGSEDRANDGEEGNVERSEENGTLSSEEAPLHQENSEPSLENSV